MTVFRIAKTEKRARDISGTGSFRTGGRWNSPGTYMLYTSENSSLAYLENLVHFESGNVPPGLFIATIRLTAAKKMIYTLPEQKYPEGWASPDNFATKAMGDSLMAEQKYPAIRVRSAINPSEHNYLLNPLFPGFRQLVRIVSVRELNIDARLL